MQNYFLSSKTPQAASAPTKVRPSNAAASQNKSTQCSKFDVVPDPQKDTEQPSDSEPEATVLFNIATALEKFLANGQMSDHVRGALGNISRYARKAGVIV